MNRPAAPAPILGRLGETRPDSGLRIRDKYVWCSSVIQAEGKWHMFSAAWPERPDASRHSKNSVLQNYLEHSVIVRSEADNPEGPYAYQEAVLEPRGSGHWDVICCHNPWVVKVADIYALFFQTCGEPGEPRRIGYVTSKSIKGPWTYASDPLPYGEDAVNPSVWVEPDGGLLMAFRVKPMRLAVARAPGLDGPWEVLNRDCMPHYSFEDPFLFHWHGHYHIVLEDAFAEVTGDGCSGVRLVSDNGSDWSFYQPEIRAYGAQIEWTNGTYSVPARRERPSLVLQDGEPTHLVTGVLFQAGRAYTARSIVTPLCEQPR